MRRATFVIAGHKFTSNRLMEPANVNLRPLMSATHLPSGNYSTLLSLGKMY